jgi:hypothetical protein
VGSARHAAYYLVRAFGEGALRAVGAAVLLLVLRIAVRNRVTASVLTVVVLALSFLGDSPSTPALRAVHAVVAGAIVLLLLTRFGVLSVGVAAFSIIVIRFLPVTLDPSQWYFARGAVGLGAVLLLAAFGFVTALGGRSALPEGVLEE